MFQVQRKVRVFIYSAIGDDDYDYDGDSDSDDVVIDVPWLDLTECCYDAAMIGALHPMVELQLSLGDHLLFGAHKLYRR